ncbi:MAG: hypothetical protein WAV41_05810 [Microgenomates group bacterium]
MDALLTEISSNLKVQTDSCPKRLNCYRGNRTIKVSNSFIARFKEFHSQDYQIYEMVKKQKVYRGNSYSSKLTAKMI